MSDGLRMGLGIGKLEPCGLRGATKHSLLHFPIVGEFACSLTSEGCAETQGQLWKMPWWTFVIKQKNHIAQSNKINN